jgi:hypothetical protein
MIERLALVVLVSVVLVPIVLLVVPAGAFEYTRRDFEALLAPFPRSLVGRVQVTEDTLGGCARSFDVRETPAAFLVNARREFVWESVGRLDPADFGAALDRHVLPAPRRASRRCRLG